MKARRVFVVLCVFMGASAFGLVPSAHSSDTAVPRVTVTGGFGNALGFLGVQGEGYLKEGRMSLFAAVGYWSNSGEGGWLPTGIAGAAGFRAYTPGSRHRGFLEASIAPLATEAWWDGPESFEQAFRYGPALQAGYQLAGRSGLTLAFSVGAGYAVGMETDGKTVMTVGLSAGYTWRRQARPRD